MLIHMLSPLATQFILTFYRMHYDKEWGFHITVLLCRRRAMDDMVFI